MGLLKNSVTLDEYEFMIREKGFKAASDWLYACEYRRKPIFSISKCAGRMTIFPCRTLNSALYPLNTEGSSSPLRIVVWSNTDTYRSLIITYDNTTRQVWGHHEFHHADDEPISDKVRTRFNTVDAQIQSLIGMHTPYPRRYFHAMSKEEDFGLKYAEYDEAEYRRAGFIR